MYEIETDAVEWLPDSATRISYVEVTGFAWSKVAEFTIDREAFQAFCEQNGWTPEKKEDVSVSFINWIYEESYLPTKPRDELVIEKALFYEEINQNGGGVTLVYDLNENRAYLSKNHH